jgi:hypothetical protein
MIFSDLPSPAEACHEPTTGWLGFAQAATRHPEVRAAKPLASKAEQPERRRLPGRKRSTDIKDRCAEYTQRKAAANH